MNIISRFFSIFKTTKHLPQKQLNNAIKLSSMIQQINNELLDGNNSMQMAGYKYIEQFFNSKTTVPDLPILKEQLAKVSKALDDGHHTEAKKKIETMTELLNTSGKNEFEAKVTDFNVPVFKGGEWHHETISLPMCSVVPASFPKIKEVKLELSVTNIHQRDDEVFFRLVSRGSSSEASKVTIKLTPEHDQQRLSDVIKHYQNTLTTQ